MKLILKLIFKRISSYLFLFFILASTSLWAVEEKNGENISLMLDLIGKKGVAIFLGVIIFVFTYSNFVKIFKWIEDQTYGTRDYVLSKLEIMFIEVEPRVVTIVLIILSFGLGLLTFFLLALFANLYIATFLGGLLFFVGWKIPRPIVDFFEKRRKQKYMVQMVDGLNLLANGIRAGLTMNQALGLVVDEMPAPISEEFNLVLQQSKIGVPLEEALENLKKRVYTEDNEMFVTSVNILRETGGNLAETFDTIVEIIRERVRLQLKIDTFVTNGKLQAYIIGSIPFIMMVIFGAGDPDYFPLLFGTIYGVIALTVIVGLVSLGMWIIFKIVKIKV